MSDRDTPPAEGTSFPETLGRTIRVLRTDQAMSRTDLAEAAGISYSYLSAIENGSKPPSTKTQMVLARVLGLKHHELLAAAEARRERGEGIADLVVGNDTAAAVAPAPQRQWRTRPPSSRTGRGDTAGLRHAAFSPDLDAARLESAPSDWTSRRPLSPASREALLEMAELVPELTDDDLAFLLEMARRLAGR